MRYAFAVAALVVCAGTVFADEPEACYSAKDPTGDFVPGKVQRFDADIRVNAQVRHLLNQSSRETGKCMRGYVQREGVMPNGAGIVYGARISPAGKVTQVSVLAIKNVNDAMLLACMARAICQWELEPDAEGKERLVALPPIRTPELISTKPGR